ncbi:MAG: helix-turn-helix domain-containing protein [Planctomycetaceae bacterium]|nr:helix-turn-helix domain-containing protein [Planctomycetaceae bacterium]
MLESTDPYTSAVSIPPLAVPTPAFAPGEIPLQNICEAESRFPLHRLAEVRKNQGVSIANLARRLNMEAINVRMQEKPTSDMLLSQLYRWREILDVPISELLIDPEDTLDDPIKSRASLVRVMKTVRSILETAREKPVQRMAQTLFDQLVEIMPELKDVSSWPTVGQSREFKDYGQAIYRRFDPGVEQAMME